MLLRPVGRAFASVMQPLERLLGALLVAPLQLRLARSIADGEDDLALRALLVLNDL